MELHEQVGALMHHVSERVVAPRFRLLAGHEISEKSAGEVVTVVDREAEVLLHEGLAALGLDARVVGEEAAADNPALLDCVGDGLVWLVDPLDGTANFVAGHPPFGMMVALVSDGEPIAGWLLDALSGRLCHAERGRGAWCDGRTVRSRTTGSRPPRAALGTHFLAPERRDRVHAHAARHFDLVPVPLCAAESYPRLALGEDDIALFQRILPWDHAAGALFLGEAGGKVTHWDRSPYRVGGGGKGVLCAADPGTWQLAAEVLLTTEAGLIEAEDAIT